jgi:ribosomal protein S25
MTNSSENITSARAEIARMRKILGNKAQPASACQSTQDTDQKAAIEKQLAEQELARRATLLEISLVSEPQFLPHYQALTSQQIRAEVSRPCPNADYLQDIHKVDTDAILKEVEQKKQALEAKEKAKAANRIADFSLVQNKAPEKRFYPEQRNQTEKPGRKPIPTENHRPRSRPKNDPELVIKGKNGNDRHTGNRCGHEPNKPEFYTRPEGKKRLPLVNQLALDEMPNYYQNPKEFLPLLNGARYRRKKLDRKLKKNGCHVKQRTERCEAIVIVAQVLFSICDIVSMRAVTKLNKDGTVEGITMEQIARRGGISLSRTEEAITDMKLAGYIKVFERNEKTDGIYTGLPAIRTISPLLYKALGLGQKLVDSRKWLYDRKKEAMQRRYAASAVVNNALLEQILYEEMTGDMPEPGHSQSFYMGKIAAVLKS